MAKVIIVGKKLMTTQEKQLLKTKLKYYSPEERSVFSLRSRFTIEDMFPLVSI